MYEAVKMMLQPGPTSAPCRVIRMYLAVHNNIEHMLECALIRGNKGSSSICVKITVYMLISHDS